MQTPNNTPENTLNEPKKGFKLNIKERFKNSYFGKWAYANPKKFYTYAMTIIVLSFVINTFFDIKNSKNKYQSPYTIPVLFEKTETMKNDESQRAQLEAINAELRQLKPKRDNGTLTPADSLRIEFLYKQYQALKK